MIKKLLKTILGDQNKKALKQIEPLVALIKEEEQKLQQTIKDQNDILAKTSEFKERLRNGETVDDLLPEAFALVKIACSQLVGQSFSVMGKEITWNMVPYDVQLIGGIVLHQGNIAEMKTGEGKTLVCTLPVYLNALTEKGVFVVTVNNYLAERDAQWMEPLYNHLGLSVGTNISGMGIEAKQSAYKCDIIYGTNNEFGFDYLRDNMATNKKQLVQRNLHYAIIDEVDSILIDEARTPLIISAPAAQSTEKYKKYGKLVKQLQENTHYDIDEKGKNATLNEEGIKKMEELMGIENIYTEAGFNEVHHIEQALRAKACYKKDLDYIIQEGEIVIIDEFTGRLMPGRRYGKGLHQAIEAKEGVEVKRESKTLATITFQNYFRLFDKLSGMTGTAETEAEEFYQIYGLDTIIIPTNKPIAREDKPDVIYKNRQGKYKSIAKKVKEIHDQGRPVLVGTVSVEQSELLSKLFKLQGLKHEVLNAKNHAKEAEIVAKAGERGAITIATNMAGRGTDIKLTPEIIELGGLFVLGTERHESRRIDNQLRGRSGRQGDKGTSQFFVSMEDDLMRKFGGEKAKKVMDMLNFPEDMPIETRIISRSIESAQKKVEGHNFDIRKHLVEYDDVMNIQRNIIYKRRKALLTTDNAHDEILDMTKELVESIVSNYTANRDKKDWDHKQIWEAINAIKSGIKLKDLQSSEDSEQLTDLCFNHLVLAYKEREAQLPETEVMRRIEKSVYLRANDVLWMEHIDTLSQLRGNVAFSGYAQKNPLNEYKAQAFDLFTDMLSRIRFNTVNTLFKIDLEKVLQTRIVGPDLSKTAKATHPSATTKTSHSSNPVVVKPSAAVRKVNVWNKEKK